MGALIGREAEVRLIVDLLRQGRRVTVVGPSGVGKSAVCRAAAERMAVEDDCPFDVVDVFGSSSAEEVEGLVSSALGVGGFEELTQLPGLRRVVMIDDVEVGRPEVVEAIASLGSGCPDVALAVTCRAPLHVPGEVIVAVPPLAVTVEASGLGRLEPGPAVELFLRFAADAGSRLAADSVPDVVEVCNLLDGVPGSIELAARRIRTMSPAELAAELSVDPAAVLAWRPHGHDVDGREVVRVAVAQLEELDRELLERSSVTSDPLDLSMLHAVMAEGSRGETAERLSRLVEASLVRPVTARGITCFRAAGPVWAFSSEQLHARGDWAPSWQRLSTHVLERAERLVASVGTGWDDARAGELSVLFPHLLASVASGLDQEGLSESVVAAVGAMWEALSLGRVSEVSVLAEAALQRCVDDADGDFRAGVAATAATCRFLLGRVDDAEALAGSILEHGRVQPLAACVLPRLLGQVHASRGDVERAVDWFQASEEAAVRFGRTRFVIESKLYQASLEVAVGTSIDSALQEVRELADTDVVMRWVHTIEGRALVGVDDSRAKRLIDDTADAARAARDSSCLLANLQSLTLLALAHDDLGAACRQQLDVIDVAVGRVGLAEYRSVLAGSARVLRVAGSDVWRDLEATADRLPFVGVATGMIVSRSAGGRPLATREAVDLARSELQRLHDTDALSSAVDPTARSASSFRRRGDVWQLRFDGIGVSVVHSKGMVDVARLLQHADREIHCTDLAEVTVEERPAGTMIDEQARREYEARLLDLQRDIEHYQRANDLAHAERAQAEFDAIVEHLSAALGLGRRLRPSTGSAERARSAVTQRIRTAIRRIEQVHPRLGAHLRAHVKTGLFCVYAPSTSVDWDVDLR